MNLPMLVFIGFVLITLAITYWAARRASDRSGDGDEARAAEGGRRRRDERG